MKKIISNIMTLICLFSLVTVLFSGCTEPLENPAEDFKYTEKDNEIIINRFIGNTPHVVVPKQINGLNVTTIGNTAFALKKEIISVTLPDTVKIIGEYAFTESSVEEIVLSNSLEEIGFSAFLKCENLKTVKLPDSLTTLSRYAFKECKSLKHINIPKNIKTVDEEVFSYTGLATVHFDNGVQEIATNAFLMSTVKEAVFPSSLRQVSWQAFGGCENLEKIVLNEGLTTIENSAFAGTKIKEITIPKTVTVVTDRSFNYCSSLDKIIFEGDAPEKFIVEDDIFGVWEATDVHFKIYCRKDAKGFTFPTWNGYEVVVLD